MPFAYYARLSKRQRAIYDKSDGVTEVRLPEAERLRPVADGLTQALGVGPVRVEVLAARPHAHWGELHGLYTEGRGARPPKITLWMRTARQPRRGGVPPCLPRPPPS